MFSRALEERNLYARLSFRRCDITAQDGHNLQPSGRDLPFKSLSLSRGKPQHRRLRSVRILWWFTRRHLRYLVQKFLFLWRKISVSARFDLPPPSLGWHGKQSLHHISHFLPRNRTLLVVRQPVICKASISGRFVVHERHRLDLVVYASRSLRP